MMDISHIFSLEVRCSLSLDALSGKKRPRNHLTIVDGNKRQTMMPNGYHVLIEISSSFIVLGRYFSSLEQSMTCEYDDTSAFAKACRRISILQLFYKKLVYKKLVLRWPRFYDTLVLCLRSTKTLFKDKSMDFIANISLNLYS